MTSTMVDSLAERLAAIPTQESIDEDVSGLVTTVLAKRDQIEALREDLKKQLREADAELAERLVPLNRVLRAAGYVSTPTAKKKKSGESKPSPESTEKMVRWLAEQAEPHSVREIAAELEISESSASKQVTAARKVELVRVAKHGGVNGKMQFFAVFPNAIERLDAGDVRWP